MADPVLAQGTYEVLRNRLRENANELRKRLERLHTERAAVFGNIETKLLSTIHIATEHNCVPRDIYSCAQTLILGSNVQFGLKSEVKVSDVFACYRFDGQHATSIALGPLEDPKFERDFAELVRYYRGATFLRFWQTGLFLYMVFQAGKTVQNIKVFKWAVEKDGIHYLDNRSESEVRLPNQYSFNWKRVTRDSHRQGKHPHISIEDRIFVECVQGDLTIKVEDNTEDGLGIYREPVESVDQTLDDAEIYYAILDNLILLKIKPYQERDFRYLAFSSKQSNVLKIPGIRRCGIELPDDHGVIFPNGLLLQSGDSKYFDHGVENLAFDHIIKAPNGEDFLYLFHEAQTGTYLQLRYNLIRQSVETPHFSHGQAFLADGKMLSIRAGETPQKHHAIQVWQTPYTSPDFRPEVNSDSLLFKIGNKDLVRGMAECQELVSLIEKDDSYIGLYSDLNKKAADILDTYFWIDREEAGHLAEPIRGIEAAASAAIEEFEKVVRVKQETVRSLGEAQSAARELIRKIDRQRADSLEHFVEGLTSVRTQRGVVQQLKELRYIDLPAVESLEKELVEFTDRLGNRCVQYLLQPNALAVYENRIADQVQLSEHVKSVADGRSIDSSLASIGSSLEVLIETIGQLKIEDTTQRTAIVDRVADVLAHLNRARSQLRAKLREISTRELESDFSSQIKLLDQSMASALEAADEPEKVDTSLTRLLVQIEELEGRYADSESLLLKLTEKRQSIADNFEAKRVQLVEVRTRRANGLVNAADRILVGIASKANRIDDPNGLRAYFASDLMVEKVKQIAENLRHLGDTVRQDDVLSRLKSIADDAMRQQRDRQELLSDGNRVITLGTHSFSVNQQVIELTTVVRNNRLHLHITGTQYFEPMESSELDNARDLWDAPYPSESAQVYRAESLAFALSQLEDSSEFNTWTEERRLEWIRDEMQKRFNDGYTRGVHDHDASLILNHYLSTKQSMGLLCVDPSVRARAIFAWQRLLPSNVRNRLDNRIDGLHIVDRMIPSPSINERLSTQIREALSIYADEFSDGNWEFQASNFILQSLGKNHRSIPVSAESVNLSQELKAQLTKQEIATLQKHLTVPVAVPPKKANGSTTSIANEETLEKDRRLNAMEAWHLALRLVRGKLEQRKESQASQTADLEIVEEVALHFVLDSMENLDTEYMTKRKKVESQTPSIGNDVIHGLVGDHPRIDGGQMLFDFYDFQRRLQHHETHVIPRWLALQKGKQLHAQLADKKLRTHELKARVLTSFVRNQLIDTVYLPRIGDNLAKQLGALGENKRTDRMGLLLLISPPGYGKTTLMEYIANRLGLVFVKINGPALGKSVTSLDPSEATNASAREEVERINLALEMGDNVMLYLDDIQHCNVELLQKFIPLCDATRRIEGVWRGTPRNYDLRGRKFVVVMAGNPYTEVGERFQIPDMLANRADVYNLGEIIGDSREAFEMSYLENCLTSNPTLQPLSRATSHDQRALIHAAERQTMEGIDLEGNLSSDSVQEMVSVLGKLIRIRDSVLRMNREYIQSAAQADDYRTEPPFKLQGSYRNMNRIAEKVVPVMNDEEITRLIISSYEQDAQTLSRDGESNLLKFKELMGILSSEEKKRWSDIKHTFSEKNRLKGLSGDESTAQVLSGILGIRQGLDSIGSNLRDAAVAIGQSQSHITSPDEVEQKVIVQHSVPRVMVELIRSQFQLLYEGLRPILEEIASQKGKDDRLLRAIEDCIKRYKEMEEKAEQGHDEDVTPQSTPPAIDGHLDTRSIMD